MTGGQLPGLAAADAPAKVVLRRRISAGLAGALLPLHSPLYGFTSFKLVVLISHNAGVALTVTMPQPGVRPDKVLRVPPGACRLVRWGGAGRRSGVGGSRAWLVVTCGCVWWAGPALAGSVGATGMPHPASPPASHRPAATDPFTSLPQARPPRCRCRAGQRPWARLQSA